VRQREEKEKEQESLHHDFFERPVIAVYGAGMATLLIYPTVVGDFQQSIEQRCCG